MTTPVSIRAYPDGPLLVRGIFQLDVGDGPEMQAGRPAVALCRCGRSRIQPLCDGNHVRLRRPPAVDVHRLESAPEAP